MPEIIKLTEQAADLKKEVAALTAAVKRFEVRVKRAERVSMRTAIAATIVLFLVLSVALVAYRGNITDRRIDGLCPILALVVGGADPNTREPGPDRDQYIASLEVMRQAYADLGCTTPFVPPRRPGAN